MVTTINIAEATPVQIRRATKIMEKSGCSLAEALNQPDHAETSLREMRAVALDGVARLLAFVDAVDNDLAQGIEPRCASMRAYSTLYKQELGNKSGHAIQLLQGLSSDAEISTKFFQEHCATPEEKAEYQMRLAQRRTAAASK